jgi:hypothetical protein
MDESAKAESELQDLLSAAWDGQLDQSSRDRMEELLSRDDLAGVQVLAKFTRIHLDLELLVSSRAAQRKAIQAITGRQRRDTSRLRRILSTKRLHRLSAAALLLIVSALVIVGIQRGWRNFFGDDAVAAAPMVRPPVLVGRLVGEPGAQWGQDGELRDGQNLYQGQVVDLVAGTARISMAVGAEIVIEAPCRAALESSNLVVLERGTVAVKVAPWAVGFRVRTADLLVTDLGTRFTVQAAPGAGTEVHVLEGVVTATTLHRSTVTKNVEVAQAVRATADGGLESVAFQRPAFASALDTASPLRPIPLANTGVAVSVGDQDLQWAVKSGDAQFGPYPQPATVCPPASTYGANDPARSQWISVADGTTRGVPVRTKYVFESTFDLSGFDLSSVRIAGLVLADNGVEEVRLNGRPLPIAPWSDWYAGVTFFNFHSLEIPGGFVPGKNVISFVVVNGTDLPAASADGDDLPEVPNPMALRVEWHGSGRPL